MPPISCECAVLGLRMRPAANTPSMRRRRTSPVVCDRCRPRRNARRRRTASTSCTPRPASTAAGRRQALGAFALGQPGLELGAGIVGAAPQLEAPNEPPEPGVGIGAVAQLHLDVLDRQVEHLGRDLGEHRVGAGADVGHVHLDHGVALAFHRHLGLGLAQEVAADRRPPRPCLRSQLPSRTWPGRRWRLSQPKRFAPSVRQGTRARVENGTFFPDPPWARSSA